MRMPSLWRAALAAAAMSAVAVVPGTAFAETLSLWARASSSNAAQHMIDLWNASHDDKIELTTIPDNQMVTKLATSVQAGDVPDLISFDLIFMPDFMKAGFLTDLTATLSADPNQAKVAKAFQDLATYDGKLYGTGFTPDVSILVYNKDIFAKAGLDAEKPALSTYDDFLAAARKIKSSKAAQAAIYPAPTSEFFQSWFDFYPLFAAETDGKQLVQDNKAQFNSPEGQKVAAFWKTLYDEGLAAKEQYNGDSFADKKAAMAIVGPWAIAVYGDKVKWGAVPVPTSTKKDQVETFSDAKNVAMYSACQNRATAWEVMKFATSKDQDGALLTKTGQMPLRTDLKAAFPDYFAKNPAYTQFADQAARTVEVPNVPNSVAIWQTFRDAYSQSVIFGKQPVADAFSGAAQKVDQLASGS